jgi:tripartite motif-containing protein 71
MIIFKLLLLFFFFNIQSKSLGKINNININKIELDEFTSITLISGFETSYGVDIDKNGYVYIPDFKQGILYKVNLTSKSFSVFFIEKNNYFKFIEYKIINKFKSNLNRPHDIYIDNDDNLYITELGNGQGKRGGKVIKIPDKQKKLQIIGDKLYNNEGLDAPTVSFVDEKNFIYVSEWRAHRILKFFENNYDNYSVFGKYLNEKQEFEEFKFHYPHSIRKDSYGNYYVADTGNNRIVKFDKYENYIGWIGKRNDGSINNNWSKLGYSIKGEELGAFNGPLDIAFYKDNFYVTDVFNNRIVKINILGESLGQLGETMEKKKTPMQFTNKNVKKSNSVFGFNEPYGIRIKNGFLLIADRGNNRIKIIKSNLLN